MKVLLGYLILWLVITDRDLKRIFNNRTRHFDQKTFGSVNHLGDQEDINGEGMQRVHSEVITGWSWLVGTLLVLSRQS